MNISRPRLRAAVVTSTVVSGLVLSILAPITAAAGTAAPASRGAQTAAAGTTKATPAKPQTAAPVGAASAFLFYVYPDPQPLCPLAVALNATADPAVDRGSCLLFNFTATGATGTLKADVMLDGAATPFLANLAVDADTDPDTYQVSTKPDATWPAGKLHLVIRDSGGPIGDFAFFHNALVGSATAEAAKAPGDPFTVTGTLAEHSKRGTFGSDKAVPATFKIRVSRPDGSVLFTSPQQTAAADGTFTYVVPAGTTTPVVSTVATNYQTALKVEVVDAAHPDATAIPPPATGAWASAVAATTAQVVVSPATELSVQNSFVSSVGWVKPGDTYPSRIVLSNPTAASVTPTSVQITAPTGSTIVKAGATTVSAAGYTWNPGAIAAGTSKTLVLESKAATTTELPTVVWRDLSTSAVLKVPTKDDQTALSHGPKVIPPSENYDTARYGDRPFPVVPVQYTDRSYQDTHSGDSLESVINDPGFTGSTFNLYQEISLHQLYPNGTVPSKGIAAKDFTYAPGFDFTNAAPPPGPSGTCHGITYEDLGGEAVRGTPLYPERITNGVYNLPGQTEYYGSDGYGSAVVSSQTPAGIQDIDHGCGDTGKLVYDAAAIADPEIDYSDYDTDKDGVVDFFMVVFAGCGGNGGSQLATPGDALGACPYDEASYDNVWPHSSTLEGSYRDPVTGLPGYTTDDQLKDLEGRPLWYTGTAYDPSSTTTTPGPDALKVLVRVGPYNVNPETAIDKASVISHEYGHSLGLPDFYSSTGRETYGDWNLMATDKSQNMDAFSRQELGWVVPEVLDSTRTETNIPNSKVDIGTITWQQPDGTPYTLTADSQGGADGVVHNSQMYVAKLPGRQLLDADVFASGDGASPSHLWWSGSGNDFNCTPVAGRNLDIKIPGLDSLTNPAATVKLSFKSRWDIEWDYDYGFVMTTVDGGENYTSHASENGYTTGADTIPPATSNNACQDTYGNGLTGSSGSYAAGTEFLDRTNGTYPEAGFLSDSYDISDLAGEAHGALRFSYATDPGLSRPGWFIDDVKVTIDPDGAGAQPARDVLVTDFESSGGPTDPAIFNGGCQEDLTTAGKCTKGWKFLAAGTAATQDHAYYLEMRDRSGFDFEGHGQIDRDPIGFTPGLYLSYTDEAHGYGNTGTDDPPAQSPLDSVPQPGEGAPNLNDAAFVDTAPRKTFTDAAATPHVDNYTDPSSESGKWEFGYGCLGFTVDSMTGEDTIKEAGDLMGDVSFTMGTGCGPFDYGYTAGGGDGGGNTAPVAAASAAPTSVEAGDEVSLSSAGTTDAQTPNDLDYTWDFGNGGTKKDSTAKDPTVTYTKAGTYTVALTVTDPQGLSDTATVVIKVKDSRPVAKIKIKPKKPFVSTKVTLSGAASTGLPGLKYAWDYGDGGTKKDATGVTVQPTFKKPGYRTLRLTVTDSKGRTSTAKQRLLVRRAVSCSARAIARTGSWRVRGSLDAPKGDYCDNLGSRSGPDTLTYRFAGPQLDVYFGRSSSGGRAALYADGAKKGTVDFRSSDARLRFRFHKVVTGLGKGRHTMRLVMLSGTAYLDSFITIR